MSQKPIVAIGQTLIASVVAFALGMTLGLVWGQTRPPAADPRFDSVVEENRLLRQLNATLEEQRAEVREALEQGEQPPNRGDELP